MEDQWGNHEFLEFWKIKQNRETANGDQKRKKREKSNYRRLNELVKFVGF